MSRPDPAATGGRVVGTAGHIDHGKTALVRALTGRDTDRLPDEKRRGISIDLGFAPLDPEDERLPVSFVDVPGHEGFIRNMVAGATGIDAVLFVVAADEGWMPQSREHALVLEALGVRRGVVALTKVDLVEPEWLELVRESVAEEVAATALAGAEIVPVSALTGGGIDQLREALLRLVEQVPARPTEAPFRLPIDRSFAVVGVGRVVTGTVWSGAVATGDALVSLPAGDELRVRSVEVHGRQAPGSRAGIRTALAVHGPGADRLGRGDVLVEPGAGWRAVRRVDARLWVGDDAPRPVESGDRLRIHHGTAEVMARVRWHGTGRVEPGGEGWARVAFEAPIVPAVGDRIVLRAYSPVTTIGGGTIADRWAPALRGSDRLTITDELASRLHPDPAARAAAAAAAAGSSGIELEALPIEAGLVGEDPASVLAAAADAVERHGGRLFAAEARRELEERLLETIDAYHDDHPLEPGMPLEAARNAVRPVAPALLEAALDRLQASGRVEREAALVARSEHRVELGRKDRALATRLKEIYREAGLEAPATEAVAAEVEADGSRLRSLLAHLEREGDIVKLGSDWFVDAGALDRARRAIVARLAVEGAVDVGACKDALGVTRKYLIPILEHLDRTGVTRREGDRRRLAAEGREP